MKLDLDKLQTIKDDLLVEAGIKNVESTVEPNVEPTNIELTEDIKTVGITVKADPRVHKTIKQIDAERIVIINQSEEVDEAIVDCIIAIGRVAQTINAQFENKLRMSKAIQYGNTLLGTKVVEIMAGFMPEIQRNAIGYKLTTDVERSKFTNMVVNSLDALQKAYFAEKLFEEQKSTTLRDDVYAKATLLYNSGAFDELIQLSKSAMSREFLSHSINFTDLPKGGAKYAKVMQILSAYGITHNMCKYFNIQPQDGIKEAEQILDILLALLKCGFTDEQRQLLATNQMMKVDHLNGDYSEAAIAELKKANKKLESLPFEFQLPKSVQFAQNYGASNLLMALRLFSNYNHWFLKFEQYLANNSKNTAVKLEQFLSYQNPHLVKCQVKCTIEEYRALNPAQQALTLPRMVDSEFKMLEFYTVFERVARASHDDYTVRNTEFLAKRKKQEEDARNSRLNGGKKGGIKTTPPQQVAPPAKPTVEEIIGRIPKPDPTNAMALVEYNKLVKMVRATNS